MRARSPFHRSQLPVQAALVVALLAAAGAQAYPISPVTLWDLTREADLVVWAEVEEVAIRAVEEDDAGYDDDEDWLTGTAQLRALETWKGPQRVRLTVRYEADLLCPAPAVYLEGERVLAFLERAPDRTWRTVALSYGTHYPRGPEVDDYRHLVAEALRLQRSPAAARPDARLDWLVEAASRPGTRWHGLFELHPEADRVHASYDQAERPASRSRLSRRHLQRIADGFVASPPTDGTLPMALAVLAGWESPEVDRAAVAATEAWMVEERVPYWIRESLGLLLLRLGDPDPAPRLATLGEPYGAIDPERLREVWARARAELAIPEVAPVELPEDVVWGVGGSTPD